MKRKVVVIPGDGIGPEIMSAALDVLKSILDFEIIQCEAGYNFWKRSGKAITEETLEAIREIGVCLKGPTITPSGPGTFKSVAATLRQGLDLYANIRPIKSRRGVKSIYKDVDFIIFRENTECLYKGLEYRINDATLGVRVITKHASERIARMAFQWAVREKRKKVTAVHKANILKETCGIFLEACREVAKSFPNIKFEEMLVDAAAYRMVINPKHFDIVVTTNMFGDILSDEAAGIIGSLGLVPSANIGEKCAMFEPVHGVVLHKAGKGLANPSAMILSCSMMLKYIGLEDASRLVEKALEEVLAEGKVLTPDMGGKATTQEMANEVIRKIKALTEVNS